MTFTAKTVCKHAMRYLSCNSPTKEFSVSFEEIWTTVDLARHVLDKPVGTVASMPGYCEDTALKHFAGMPNRRTWDAMSFPIHPMHDSSRYAMCVDRVFFVGTVDDKRPHDLWGIVVG